MPTRRLAMPAAALALALTLTSGIPAAAAEQKVKLRLAGWFTLPVGIVEETVSARFSQYFHPNVEVTLEPVPYEQYVTKAQTQMAGGNAPDILWWDAFAAEPLMAKGALKPLDDYMDRYDVRRTDFLGPLLDAFTYQGKVYGIPKDFSSLALFYNKRLFREAGVPLPTDAWTWDDLTRASRAIQSALGPKGVTALALSLDPARWLPFVYQNGGAFFSEDRSKVVIDSPAAVEAVEFYARLKHEGLAGLPSDLGGGWEGGTFSLEKAAMTISGPWLVDFLDKEAPNVDYGVVRLPAGPEGRANMLFTVAYVIPATSRNPETAWQLVEYLTSLETQLFVLRSQKLLPTRAGVVGSGLVRLDPRLAVFTIDAAEGVARPHEFGPLGQKAVDELQAAMESVWLGQATAQKALMQAAQVLNAELAKIRR